MSMARPSYPSKGLSKDSDCEPLFVAMGVGWQVAARLVSTSAINSLPHILTSISFTTLSMKLELELFVLEIHHSNNIYLEQNLLGGKWLLGWSVHLPLTHLHTFSPPSTTLSSI